MNLSLGLGKLILQQDLYSKTFASYLSQGISVFTTNSIQNPSFLSWAMDAHFSLGVYIRSLYQESLLGIFIRSPLGIFIKSLDQESLLGISTKSLYQQSFLKIFIIRVSTESLFRSLYQESLLRISIKGLYQESLLRFSIKSLY